MRMQRNFGGEKLHRVSVTLTTGVCANIRTRTNACRVLDKQQLPGILVGGTCPGVSYQLQLVVLAANRDAPR